MKTISGSITSSKSISLSKSASVLHKFINEDTGASQAISVYLKRASEAFDELVEFRNELKGRSHRKHKKIRVDTLDSGALTDAETSRREEGELAAERSRFIDSVEELSYWNGGELEGEDFDNEGINSRGKKVREGGAGVRIVEVKREETKKRKTEEVEDGGLNDSKERLIRKNKETKKSIKEEVEDGGLNYSEEQLHIRKNKETKKKSIKEKVEDGGLTYSEELHIRKNKETKKKRKIEEFEDGGLNDSEEHIRKIKKTKRRSEV